MSGLRELFEEAANSSAPPSRLTAEQVYAAGRRRRRRRSALAGGAAAATCFAAVAVIALLAPEASQVVARKPSAGGTASDAQRMPGPGLLPEAGERIQWAGAADAQHLYLMLSTLSSCAAPPCAKTIMQVVGSDDGGHTWSNRGAPINVASVAVLGADQLVATVLVEAPKPNTQTLQVSVDGGRSWQPTGGAPAVAAVPAGSAAVCWPDKDGARQAEAPGCALYALDPVSRRLARLSAQPPLTVTDDLRIEASAGRLWAPGIDPATNRPAIAVSADAGRNWSTHVFADAPGCAVDGCPPPSLATGTGGTAYAVVSGDRARAVYRHSAGQAGGWQRVAAADRVPFERADTSSFVTADGTHVLCHVAASRAQGVAGCRFWALGDAYQPVQLDGLPDTVYLIRRTADGLFYTYSYTDNVLYGSRSGWLWSPLTRKGQ
jgi:hypothetical protein